jgi:hypothetical protein
LEKIKNQRILPLASSYFRNCKELGVFMKEPGVFMKEPGKELEFYWWSFDFF